MLACVGLPCRCSRAMSCARGTSNHFKVRSCVGDDSSGLGSTDAGERREEVEPFPPSLQGLWGCESIK
jgi:hypothetical protein